MSRICSELVERELSRMVSLREGWELPVIGEDWLEFQRLSSEHRARVQRWLAENPEDAERMRAEAERVATEHHDARCRERVREWLESTREAVGRQVQAFLAAAGVGQRTAAAVIASLDETEALAAARAWAKSPDGGALLLLGDRGTGKTVAAAWALTALGSIRWSRCFCDRCQGCAPADGCLVAAGHPARVFEERLTSARGRFVKAGHLADALHKLGGEETWHDARKAAVLVIDDLGREYADQHGRFTAALDLLIDDRHEAGLRTVITSNLSPVEFRDRYGERITDRIRQAGRVVACTGESLRRSPKA